MKLDELHGRLGRRAGQEKGNPVTGYPATRRLTHLQHFAAQSACNTLI